MSNFLLKLTSRLSVASALWVCLASGLTARAQEAPAGLRYAAAPAANVTRGVDAGTRLAEEEPASVTAAAASTIPSTTDPLKTQEPGSGDETLQVDSIANRMKFFIFGNTGYQIGNYYGPTNTFQFGEAHFFVSARLTDRLSTLVSVLFIANSNNTIGFDIERMILSYKQNDYLRISIGRIYTSIGYYNTAFNRQDYLQTTVGPPILFEFDDSAGGFLPLQDLGIVVDGNLPSGKANLHYVFEVTNGRDYGVNSEPAQNNSDHNNSKAVNFGMSTKPEQLSGLVLGFSVRHDYLSDSLNLHVSEIIPVVYVVFTNSTYEFLNEATIIRHTLPGGPIFHTTAFYSQFSRRFGHFRPYFRYSYVNSPNSDPIYNNPIENPVVGRVNGPTIGIRWDFTRFTAFKLQYDREDMRGAKPTNGGNVQLDFTF